MRRLPMVLTALAVVGCGEHARPTPSSAGITLTVPNPIVGRYQSCTPCPASDLSVVAEFAVVVGDPGGPGGVVARLEVRVFNRSRNVEVARNTRPNAAAGLPDASLPAAGQLRLDAGIVFSPPPPRDEVVVSVIATLTDGRQTSRTVPLVIEAALPAGGVGVTAADGPRPC